MLNPRSLNEKQTREQLAEVESQIGAAKRQVAYAEKLLEGLRKQRAVLQARIVELQRFPER